MEHESRFSPGQRLPNSSGDSWFPIYMAQRYYDLHKQCFDRSIGCVRCVGFKRPALWPLYWQQPRGGIEHFCSHPLDLRCR
ncbi:hypothetical protein IG631_05638 [Alternaria alternata]|nr:hypothetical protein IG631_05638 [Alternaria alternata]